MNLDKVIRLHSCMKTKKDKVQYAVLKGFTPFLSAVLRDCAAAMVAGIRTGVTTIYPDGITAMNVYCDQDTNGGGWIVRYIFRSL